MCTQGPRQNPLLFLGVVEVWVFNWTTGFQIDMARPGHCGKGISPQQLAILAVKHIEKTILGCLQQNLAHFAVHFHVGKGHILYGCVVPVVAGCGLVVPLHRASIGIKGNNGGKEQIIAATGGANDTRPR